MLYAIVKAANKCSTVSFIHLVLEDHLTAVTDFLLMHTRCMPLRKKSHWCCIATELTSKCHKADASESLLRTRSVQAVQKAQIRNKHWEQLKEESACLCWESQYTLYVMLLSSSVKMQNAVSVKLA